MFPAPCETPQIIENHGLQQTPGKSPVPKPAAMVVQAVRPMRRRSGPFRRSDSRLTGRRPRPILEDYPGRTIARAGAKGLIGRAFFSPGASTRTASPVRRRLPPTKSPKSGKRNGGAHLSHPLRRGRILHRPLLSGGIRIATNGERLQSPTWSAPPRKSDFSTARTSMRSLQTPPRLAVALSWCCSPTRNNQPEPICPFSSTRGGNCPGAPRICRPHVSSGCLDGTALLRLKCLAQTITKNSAKRTGGDTSDNNRRENHTFFENPRPPPPLAPACGFGWGSGRPISLNAG